MGGDDGAGVSLWVSADVYSRGGLCCVGRGVFPTSFSATARLTGVSIFAIITSAISFA